MCSDSFFVFHKIAHFVMGSSQCRVTFLREGGHLLVFTLRLPTGDLFSSPTRKQRGILRSQLSLLECPGTFKIHVIIIFFSFKVHPETLDSKIGHIQVLFVNFMKTQKALPIFIVYRG